MIGFFSAVEGFDFWFTQLAQSWESALLTQIMLALTFLGHPLFWMLITSVVYWHGKEKEAFYLGFIMLFSAAVVGMLKPVFARPRPSIEQFKRLTADFYSPLSFPSGHSTLVASYWVFLSKYLKKILTALLLVFVLLVAFSRIYLGVHFASDVIVGILIGIVIGKVTLYLKEKADYRHLKPTKLMDSLAITGILAIALLALLFLESIPLAAFLIGFFGGFFLSKQIGFDSPVLTGKPLIVKEATGFLVLGLIFLAIPYITSLQLPFGLGQQGQTRTFLSYVLIGFWVSFIWPLLHQKLFKKQ